MVCHERGQITYTLLSLDTHNIVDVILSTICTQQKKNTGTNSQWRVCLPRWAHHRQSSGGTKSYYRVGSIISPRDINCGFHMVSHCVNETPSDKTHPGQALSVLKLKCALRRKLIASCFTQEKSKIVYPPWVNHGFSLPCQIYGIVNSHREAQQITSKVWDPSQENYKEPKTKASSFGVSHDLHARNLTRCKKSYTINFSKTTAELEWKDSELWSGKPSSNLMEGTSSNHHTRSIFTLNKEKWQQSNQRDYRHTWW